MIFFCSLSPEMIQNEVLKSETEPIFGWEWRLDLLRDIPIELGSSQPWMATYRTKKHGGQGNADLRDGLGWELRKSALEKGASWLDIEMDENGIEEKIQTGRRLGANIVLSTHYFTSDVNWNNELRRGLNYEPDVIKLIGMGSSFHDFETQIELYKRVSSFGAQLVHFFMGAEFQSTRLLSLMYGAPFTFYSPSGYTAPAPGQITEKDIYQFIKGKQSNPDVLFAIGGYPVAHSFSPEYHLPRLRKVNKDIHFLKFPIQNGDELKRCWDIFPNLRGMSITKPLKEKCGFFAQQGDVPSVNTLVKIGHQKMTANTDRDALLMLLRDAKQRCDSEGAAKTSAAVLRILGFGGVGKMAIQVGLELNLTVEICNRTPLSAEQVPEGVENLPWGNRHQNGCHILLQATSCGMGDETICPVDLIPDGTLVVMESIYHPRRTRILRMAEEKKIFTIEGQRFFDLQAEAQSNWFLKALG